MKTKVTTVKRIPKKYFTAVENGIVWLDLTFGRREWLKKMDMTNFDISDPFTCVAGNVFRDGMFSNEPDGFAKFLDLIDSLGGGSNSCAIRLGFNWEDNTGKGQQHLQDIWVRRITQMKKTARIN